MRKIILDVEKGIKRHIRHIKNNVFILYLPNRTKIRPGENIKIQMKFGVVIPQDIIYIVTRLPLFQTVGLKLSNYEPVQNTTMTDKSSRKLQINLNNTDSLKTVDLKKGKNFAAL